MCCFDEIVSIICFNRENFLYLSNIYFMRNENSILQLLQGPNGKSIEKLPDTERLMFAVGAYSTYDFSVELLKVEHKTESWVLENLL